MVLGSDVILFNRRIKQFDGEQNEEHADHSHVPSWAGFDEKREQHRHGQDDHLLADRGFMRDGIAKPCNEWNVALMSRFTTRPNRRSAMPRRRRCLKRSALAL